MTILKEILVTKGEMKMSKIHVSRSEMWEQVIKREKKKYD